SFNLKRTNQLGNLVIKWNGYELFDDVANLNHYDLEVPPERIMDDNHLEISCAGPGWMFWQTNFYELKNFIVYAEYGPEMVVPFDLSIDELERWDKAEFSFFVTGDDEATILIKLNGDVIYSGNDAGEKVLFDVNYTSADLKPGTNLMAFVSEGGKVRLHNAKMKIKTFGNDEAVLEKTIDISGNDYTYVSRHGAYLDVKIKEILKNGMLTISINGKKINVPISAIGKTSVFVDSTKFMEGQNAIEFSGTGAWIIENIKIYTKR
ncbi:MAG: hypothetical protein GXO64_01475, partial [Candidatus Micrarchaeota archaeon]|nr:hypothetical protein [Candidatus Micrarchaeota archaeon]